VKMPKVIRILHAELDLPRLRVAVEDAHGSGPYGRFVFLAIVRSPMDLVSILTGQHGADRRRSSERRSYFHWPPAKGYNIALHIEMHD
jgi:hypothetical protein